MDLEGSVVKDGDVIRIGGSVLSVHIHSDCSDREGTSDEVGREESRDSTREDDDREKMLGCVGCGWKRPEWESKDRLINLTLTGRKCILSSSFLTLAAAPHTLHAPILISDVEESEAVEAVPVKVSIRTQKPAYTISQAFDPICESVAVMDVEEDDSVVYIDRASERRIRDVPQDLPLHTDVTVKPVLSCKRKSDMKGKTKKEKDVMPDYGKGRAMLVKMGWRSGNGLGANQQGVVEALTTLPKKNKHGIGKS
jgi:G-patch domain